MGVNLALVNSRRSKSAVLRALASYDFLERRVTEE
uniref:Uncharacterized protein n=1 Tax=Anguilla anguilla TaxID=7936 RepID=A0A0E9UQ90_ANGAN